MTWIRAYGGAVSSVPDGRTVTPINDVTIWQQCAGIANPTYTTLADVLADTGILQTLMASDNAIDYLVRSTTFASDVCADANAMTYIGRSNYASDTLLDNSTWRTEICNSTYFESVLNVKVPVMTSNTTPSGEAFAINSQDNNHLPWRAFTDNYVDQWASNSLGGSTGYIGYDFKKSVKIYKVQFYIINESSGTQTLTYKLQSAPTKNGGYTDLTTATSSSFSGWGARWVRVVLNGNTDQSYRATITSPGAVGAQKCNIYGREDV